MRWEIVVVNDLKISDVRKQLRAHQHVISPRTLFGIGSQTCELVAFSAPYLSNSTKIYPSSIKEALHTGEFANVNIEVSTNELVFRRSISSTVA